MIKFAIAAILRQDEAMRIYERLLSKYYEKNLNNPIIHDTEIHA